MKKEINIFGAGKYGKALFHFLENIGVGVYCFLQNRVEEGALCEEHPVYTLRDFEFDRENTIVLLAVADKNVKRFAKSSLIMRGLNENSIFDCSKFIEDNCLAESGTDAKEHYCIICGNRVKEFLPMGEETEIFNKHHIIGGGKRSHAVCPNCGCLDRNRWCMYVLGHYTDIVYKPCTVLHFAPEEGITRFIRTNNDCIYYSADLMPNRAMIQVNLTDILFRDSKFDFIIVNHVLEHITDERKAIQELKRVLKDNGVLVMSFPICMDQDTFEDASIVTEEERLLKYGQEDHVRLYGRDFKNRLESYGLTVEVKIPQQELTLSEIEKYGFIPDDIILLCRI